MDNYFQQTPFPQRPQQVNPIPPPIPESPKAFDWLKWVLIIVVVALLSSGLTYFILQLQPQRQTPPQVTQTAPSSTPSVSPAPNGVGETANWKTYTNTRYGYSIKYPLGMSIEENQDYVWLDKQIYIVVSGYNPEQCRGDCPTIETATDVKIGQIDARRLSGLIGAVGGDIPQKYQTIVIFHNKYYYILTLYELKNDANFPPNRIIGEIPDNKIKLFNQILSTFKFTDLNR